MAARTAARGGARLSRCSDDELLDLARVAGTDSGAYDELYRRHETVARSVARYLLSSRHDADDVVSDAFAGVIAAINHGAGPRTNFRQYVMACVRNGCKSRRDVRTVATDPTVLERHSAVFEDPDRFSEAGIVANAFSTLSIDWQRTLWLTAVEQQPTDEVARQLRRKPAAVAALAHRAREAFAEAYLAQHQARITDASCEAVSSKLAHYVRGHAGAIETIRIEQHLSDCTACACAVSELRDVNSSLRSLAGPAPLLAGGAATVAATALSGALVGSGAGLLGGAAVLKAAIIGALLIPAAIITVRAVEHDDASNHSFAAAETSAEQTLGGDDAIAVGARDDDDPAGTTSPRDSVDAVGDAADPATTRAAADEPSVPTTHLAPSAVTDVVSTVGSVIAKPAAGKPSPAVVGPVTIGVGGSGTAQPTASVSAGAYDDGVHVGVGLTVPIITIPVSLDVTLPTVTVPSVSTPPIVIPEIVVPSNSLPTIITPTITVPAITVPPVSTPGITLPQVSSPTISVPPVPLPVVTLPSIPQLFP